MSTIRVLIIFGVILGIGFLAGSYFSRQSNNPPSTKNGQPDTVSVIILGDDYVLGTGIVPSDSWPKQLERELQTEIPTLSIDVLAGSGWTTQDMIDYAVPALEEKNPQVILMQVGMHDWIQQVTHRVFRERYTSILDALSGHVSGSRQVLLLTIPDLSAAPVGYQFSSGRDIPSSIQLFNAIIIEEATKRGMRVIDIFPTSQKMFQNLQFIAPDNRHPSGDAYREWAELIEPAVKEAL